MLADAADLSQVFSTLFAFHIISYRESSGHAYQQECRSFSNAKLNFPDTPLCSLPVDRYNAEYHNAENF